MTKLWMGFLGLALTLLMLGCTMKMEGHPIQKFGAPDGNAELEVRGDDPILFGTQTLYLYLSHDGSTTRLPDYTLHNDGTNLRDDQIQVTWPSDHIVEIKMRGEEQEDELLRYAF